MIDDNLLREVKRIVGHQHVFGGRADAEVYSYDGSLAVGAPEAVVLTADTQQTAAVVRAATRARVPYLPRGFGTNLSGGSVAASGGLVIGLSRLNRILAVRPEGRYAVVQPGVTNLELQNALAPLGFFYAPDPASQKVATMGGNVGENSGGPHCLKYGVTANHVLGMTVVLPGGQVVRTGGPALDPPGYDLRGVLIGSEGTLAIVTELVVRILPSPEAVVTLLAVYDDIADAARSVSEVIAAGIVPATLEMMDGTVIRAVEESMPCGYPLDAAAVLIAEVDGPAAGLQRQADRISELCSRNGCREVRKAKDAAERDLLWAGRRGAFGAIARLAPSFLVADCTVPRTRLPEALTRVAEIAQKHDLPHGNVFHAGDGNLHPLLLFDSRDGDQLQRVHTAGREIMEACVALGGTITGEHGIGMEKSHAMRMIFSEDDLDFQRRLRNAFDPDDLLNPGKIIPPRPDEAPLTESDVGPLPHDRELIPADAAEACQMVRRAAIDRVGLWPMGNGSRLHSGSSLPNGSILFRSTGISAVVEYDPGNQVVAAGSGMCVASLQDLLAKRGQWLPLRPPNVGGTLGGLVALAQCGPERLRYGAPRDLLLGLKFVSGAGRLISAGGRVVKNVAGYDLTRLLAGSAGTLGLITELTLRVAPLPQCCTAVVAVGRPAECAAAASALLASKLEPALVIATPDQPELKIDGDGQWQLIAGFEGFEEAVGSQVEGCRRLLPAAGLSLLDCRAYPAREGVCTEFFDTLGRFPFILRADLLPDAGVTFIAEQRELLRGAAVLVDFGCGRVVVGRPDLTDISWRRFCGTAEENQGHATIQKAPASAAGQFNVFGPPREDWQLMHGIKAALDPDNVFAPGSFPDGQ